MPDPHLVVTLDLLGHSSLTVAGHLRFLERKAAGVLAYICLKQPVTREEVAGLLWPDILERSARTNLRQVLWRLRSYGTDLVVGGQLLTLADHVNVDVVQFNLAALAGHDLDHPAWEGELLAGKNFSDCPDFEEWIQAERRRLRTLRQDALWRQCSSAQNAGELDKAIQSAGRLLALDPLSEAASRLLMTLYVAKGDRAAALMVFQTCREILRRELGVSPSTETLALADRIRHASLGDDVQGKPILPVTWQPSLIGRNSEWRQLNAALNAGQTVMVSGPPGVGKTRLLLDVLQARGAVVSIDSRPNDETVPYLALGRLVRQLLKAHQDATRLHPDSAPLPVEDWVLAETALLLTDRSREKSESALLDSVTAQRRLLEAVARLITSLLPLALAAQREHGSGTAGSLMLDNVQWTDERSWEAWLFVFAQPEWQALGVHVGLTFRQGELPPAQLEAAGRLVDGGVALIAELQPLSEDGVRALTLAFLEHRNVRAEVGPGRVKALWRHTGGNPLFVLETLRVLFDEPSSDHDQEAEALPVPPQLEQLLRRRLERLSAPALRLARVAAVAGSEFDAELAAQVMQLHPLDLAQPWAELEAAQIMNGSNFAHDMIAQAAGRSVPLPVRVLLHGSMAAHLQERDAAHPRSAAPEHIALHWEAAGQPSRAAPQWLRAGWMALALGAWTDAARDFRRAMITGHAERESRMDAQYGLGLALRGLDPVAAEEALLAVLALTPDLHREMKAAVALAELYRLGGRLGEALTQIVRATELADEGLPEAERAELWRARFAVHLRAGQYEAAEKAILTAQALAPWRTEMVNEHALLCWMSGRLTEAARLYEGVRPQDAAGRQPRFPPWYAGNLGWTYWGLGRLNEAEAILALPLDPPGSPFDVGVRLVHQGTVSISQGRYLKALHELEAAEPALRAYPPHRVDLLHRRGLLALYAARYDEAAAVLTRAVNTAQEVGDPVRLLLALSALVQVYVSLRRPAEAHQWAQQVRELSAQVPVPLTRILSHQVLALVAELSGDDAQAIALAAEAVRQARACQMQELLARSLLVRASLHASLQPGDDLREAAQLAESHGMLDVHYRATCALAALDSGSDNLATTLYRQLLSAAPAGFFNALPHRFSPDPPH